MKAERALAKVEQFLQPANRQADPESITNEERFMFRKLGLRMKAFLLLGKVTIHAKFITCFFLLTMSHSWEIDFLIQVDVGYLMVLWKTCICIGNTGS